MNPRADIVVIGGGRFGRLAVERLPGKVSLVVEPSPDPVLLALGVPVLERDGVEAGALITEDPNAAKWLVPALPKHFLALWLQKVIQNIRWRPASLPFGSVEGVLSCQPGPQGCLYLSQADFLCPDDCPEPADHCTVTGHARPRPLFGRLMDIQQTGWRNGGLRSRQLAPGVGGFRISEMIELRERLRKGPGKWMIWSACRCHGVIQGFDIAKE